MTREEAIRWLEDIHRRFNPTGENLENEGGDVHLQALDMAIEALSDRPTGEWVRKYDKQINCYWYECNQCGEYRPRNVFGNEWSSPYCPNCGARMYKGGDEE